ncbi:MAG TPA: polysaccharide deacetylase family protein, partial [Magnetococcales bacterium]|nr:polysaccharide deacetylase family protein [Magnetococcales bacterium]
MKTLSVRSLGLFVLLWCALASSLAQGSSSGEHVRVAKYSYMPTSSNYLSPGGEVEVPWDWLSLPEERIMALTFDDGPEERDLEIANLLTKQGIEATFFFIGNKVDASPGVVKKVMGAGHEIGYHSYRHQKLSWISQTDLKEDFRLGKASLNTLGVPVVWFRPPYGLFNSRVVKTAKEQGMETILWTVDPKDWTGIGPETIAKRVIRTFHPGAVLLFHSNHAATLQALPEIIEAAKAREYRFVSLTEWRRTIQTVHCRMS